jgi:hypothetical protein
MRFEVSVAGTGVPRVLPSKTIVGSAAVEAYAGEGIATRPVRANRPVRTIEIALFEPDMDFEFASADILGLPLARHLIHL